MARKSRKNILQTEMQAQLPPVVYQAAFYIRLSVEDSRKRGNSIETQTYILEDFVEKYPEIQVMTTYIDNGNTGTNFDRPAFKQMIADIESKKINCILVKDLSRLGRNAIDTGFYIEKYFPLHQVRFIAVNDDFDTNSNKNNSILLPLKNMINEAYSLDIGRKIKAQIYQSMKEGEYVGGRSLYGYIKSPDNCHKLIVDENTAPIVRQIFEWAYQGVGVNSIVRFLNEAGIETPSKYAARIGTIKSEKLIGNGHWNNQAILRILSREIYTGDMIQGKSKRIDHKQYPIDKSEWIVVKNTHEAIISHEVFEKVQHILKESAMKTKQRKVIPYTENIFKGHIFCQCCGKSLHRQRSGNRYLFYCVSNNRIARGYCEGVIFYEEDLKTIVLQVLQKQAEVIIGRRIRLNNSISILEQQREQDQKEVVKLKQEVVNYQKFQKSLFENLVKGILIQSEYLDLKSSYEKKIQQATSRISELEQKHQEIQSSINHFNEYADQIVEIKRKTELTSELIKRLVERIWVSPNQQIEVEFSFKSEFPKEIECYE